MESDSVLIKKSTIKDLIGNLTSIELKLSDGATESAEMHRVHCQFILLNLLGEDVKIITSDDVISDLEYSKEMLRLLGCKFDHINQRVTPI